MKFEQFLSVLSVFLALYAKGCLTDRKKELGGYNEKVCVFLSDNSQHLRQASRKEFPSLRAGKFFCRRLHVPEVLPQNGEQSVHTCFHYHHRRNVKMFFGTLGSEFDVGKHILLKKGAWHQRKSQTVVFAIITVKSSTLLLYLGQEITNGCILTKCFCFQQKLFT